MSFYVARLVPIGRPVSVVCRDEGAIREMWNAGSFALERKKPERVAVLVDHDPDLVVGRMSQLLMQDGWLTGVFSLDDTETGRATAECIDVGTPMSVGFDPDVDVECGESGIRQRALVTLKEVSFVRRSAHGGKVTMKFDTPPSAQRAGTVIHHEQRAVWRHGSGQVLGVR